MRVVTAAEMLEIERLCSSTKTLSEEQMAETAGYRVALEVDRMENWLPPVILCGPGNNGADGLIAAFYLSTEFGNDVEVVLAAEPQNLRPLGKKAYRRLAETDVKIFTPGTKQYSRRLDDLKCDNVIVDALLGSGQKGPPKGEVAKVMEALDGHGRTVVLDVPTGIDSDTGEVLGAHPKPFVTLCIGLPKRYLFTGEGRLYAANWKLVKIGLPESLSDGGEINLVGAEVARLLPSRTSLTHKRSSVVLSIAGSSQYPGAAALAASAAYRMGAGMVVAAGPTDGLNAVRTRVIEAPLVALPGNDGQLTGDSAAALEPWLSQAHSVVLGPGIGRSTGAGDAVEALLQRGSSQAWVIDGDALFHVAERAVELGNVRAVLTPHAGEAARLLGATADDIDANRFDAAAELAGKYNQVVILKGHHSIVATPEGAVDVIATGSPLLATAGTGDVLSGIIGSLLAQKLNPRNAAVLGGSVHGYLAEVNTVRLGHHTYGVLASELAEEIPVIVTLMHESQLVPRCLEEPSPDSEEDEIDEEDF